MILFRSSTCSKNRGAPNEENVVFQPGMFGCLLGPGLAWNVYGCRTAAHLLPEPTTNTCFLWALLLSHPPSLPPSLHSFSLSFSLTIYLSIHPRTLYLSSCLSVIYLTIYLSICIWLLVQPPCSSKSNPISRPLWQGHNPRRPTQLRSSP